MKQKERYNKFDFIEKNELIYLNISNGNDGLLSHSHDFYELVMVTEGHGTHVINDTSYLVMPGDIFLLMPSDVHSFIPINKNVKFSWLSCIWLPEFYEIKDDTLLSTKKYSDEYTHDIYNELLNMHTEFYNKKDSYMEILHLFLQAILLKLHRLIQNRDESYGAGRKNKLIKEAINYIHANYTRNIELSDIAAHINISHVYLCKLFKASMQTGAMNYVRKIRIERAMQLISSTDMSIESISSEVGFTDIKSLYSLFKQKTGVTPGEYRKHYK